MYAKAYIFCLISLLGLIVLGAYTRIADAGLGCPDWPGCYGQAFIPTSEQIDVTHYDMRFFDRDKAAIEMWHRYLAGSLGLCLLFFMVRNIVQRKQQLLSVFILLLLGFQANLGRLTVTMKLQPIIVSLHLLFGFLLFFSFFASWQKRQNRESSWHEESFLFKMTCFFYGLQVLLGAWVSTNYAGLACLDLPSCSADSTWTLFLKEPLNLYALWNASEPLGFFSLGAKQAIHMLHRVNAVFLGVFLIIWVLSQWRYFSALKKRSAILLCFVYTLQLVFGLALIILRLPVALAAAHNCLAALMGVALLSYLYTSEQVPRENE